MIQKCLKAGRGSPLLASAVKRFHEFLGKHSMRHVGTHCFGALHQYQTAFIIYGMVVTFVKLGPF